MLPCAAVIALAQPEQWLNYRTLTEGTGYRTVQPVTNAPAGVALPVLGPVPWFAKWDTPLDATGGRWLCFDQSRKGGPYDRLYFDSNGNGRLDDESPIAAYRVERYTTERAWTYFGPVRLTLPTPDGPVAYHLMFRTYIDRDRALLVTCRAAGQYEGTVDFAGKKLRVRLIDDNVNGTFNDTWADPDGPDEIEIEGQTPASRALGRFVEVEGELFQIEVPPDGAFVKVSKATRVRFGQVSVPRDISTIRFIGPNGEFRRTPTQGVCRLPVGTYTLAGYTLTRKDARGVLWRFEAYSFPDSAIFELEPDQTVNLALGEPVRAEVTAIQLTNMVEFDLRFIGSLGERMLPYRGEDRPRPPKLSLASLDGSYRVTNNFSWG